MQEKTHSKNSRYIYGGVEYPSFDSVPFTKGSRAVAGAMARRVPVKCNRALYIQKAYRAILDRGHIVLPDVDYWDLKEAQKDMIRTWLGLKRGQDLNRSHLEAIRVALDMLK